MTNPSPNSNGQPSASIAAEPVRLRAARGDGTLVSVDLAARILGIRLLTLRAEVRVAPAPVDVLPRAGSRPAARTSAGRPVGGGLVDAARAIRSGAVALEAARDRSAG